MLVCREEDVPASRGDPSQPTAALPARPTISSGAYEIQGVLGVCASHEPTNRLDEHRCEMSGHWRVQSAVYVHQVGRDQPILRRLRTRDPVSAPTRTLTTWPSQSAPVCEAETKLVEPHRHSG